MKTRIALLQREAAEIVVRDITPIEMVLIVSGVLFWALLAFAVIRWAVLRSEWLTEKPPDIPDFIICSCPSPKCPRHPHNFNSNRTAAMSIVDFQRTDEGA